MRLLDCRDEGKYKTNLSAQRLNLALVCLVSCVNILSRAKSVSCKTIVAQIKPHLQDRDYCCFTINSKDKQQKRTIHQYIQIFGWPQWIKGVNNTFVMTKLLIIQSLQCENPTMVATALMSVAVSYSMIAAYRQMRWEPNPLFVLWAVCLQRALSAAEVKREVTSWCNKIYS